MHISMFTSSLAATTAIRFGGMLPPTMGRMLGPSAEHLFTVTALESVDVAGSFVQLEVGFKGERCTTLFTSKLQSFIKNNRQRRRGRVTQ